ncbi:hypothetical protein MYCTH_107520 [Thermothelomyces thermophilus ATCC 42464]|uniref:DUF4211 domain-containing protein n=1 Tax=Thermothelomyces thermophilus (strain ATCC 42464 / BCRC 31852 / DSM 1799) TaxID=573729 RepID=G2QBH6_THET4|nr:uncharacterized protein MYCTH_107520 [Thermothelomyces thermophilus ATCC 42464]AEO57919.1 hypothetical protein MYCTH_107520 [Thermothelomyces thermophilus ATCC 42464]
MVKPRREKQQTLEATLGRPPVRPTIKTPRKSKPKQNSSAPASSSPAKIEEAARSSPLVPSSSFLHSSQVLGSARKKKVVYDDSSSEEASEDEAQAVTLPVVKTGRSRQRQSSEPESSTSSSDEEEDPRGDSIDRNDGGDGVIDEDEDDEDEDDAPLAAPTTRRKRRLVADESDEDDRPIVSSPIKRRRLVRGNLPSSSPEQGNTDEDEEEAPAPTPARPTRARRKPLTKKEKARELLRRKRAGEVINEDEEISSSENEPVKAMYDTDSDHVALNEFEDDEEGVYEPKVDDEKERKAKKKKEKEEEEEETDEAGADGESEAESMDDFVVDDSDAPIGAPDLDIPLKFTRHSHKHLREHFRDAIEWLVHLKINPGFSEREHPLFRMAWRKLDDEVRGLATSKFSSSAWKSDFQMALRARPEFTSAELPKGDMLESRSCDACGRSGHPARHIMTFSGTPYFKDAAKLYRFLQPVEANSSDSASASASDSHDEDEEADEDEDGNLIPKESKQWFIGAVCNSNAETAHTLMHWKFALLTWVETRLHEEGYMAPSALAERERMRPKKKYKLVDKIMSRWVESGVVKALYQDFKGTIEQARNKPTTGRHR